MLDFTELPKKYSFNKENLSELKYIDDNSLYVSYSLLRGWHSTSDPAMSFLFRKPFEWNSIDFVSFLLYTVHTYGFEISNIETISPAVEEAYRVSMVDSFGQPDVMKLAEHQKMVIGAMLKHDKTKPFKQPVWYEGAYKWILELQEKEPEREEVSLFNKFYTNTATLADIERLLVYADRITPLYEEEESELYLSKDLFKRILDYTSFSVVMNDDGKKKLEDDFNTYLTAFTEDRLIRNRDKRIRNTMISQSDNIYTFRRHNLMLREYLQKMQSDYGDAITIKNIFEDAFPDSDDVDNDELRQRFLSKHFYFCHILIAYERMGLIKIISFGSNWSIYERGGLAYRAKIEILSDFNNENSDKKLCFDLIRSRLYVQGKEIKLQKFKDEYHTLRVLFEDPNELGKEWFFSEIKEHIDAMARGDDKKYYNAIYQIKIKLEKQGISDFFLTTKHSVKINPKYLS